MHIPMTAAALLLGMTLAAQQPNLSAYDLRCEHQTAPIGMDEKNPRLTWKIASNQEDVLQTAYEIRVSTDPGFRQAVTITKDSDQNIDVEPGIPLSPWTRYYWQVRIRDNKGQTSRWSPSTYFETGFFGNPWKAKWIEPEKQIDAKNSLPPVRVRKTFTLQKKIISARLYITARGLYLARINGKAVTEDIFTPGWTSYNKRLQYQAFDVTANLQNGNNAIGVELAEGWYRGTLGWGDNRNLYGKKLGLLAELHLRYADGSMEVIPTDESWKASDQGPVRMSGIYDGETYDARMEQNGWDQADYAERDWWPVTISAAQQQPLTWQQGAPVKRIEELKPVRIFRTPKGEWVADMGQNMVGRMRITVEGPAGTNIRLSHAEVLDKQGNFYTENLRAAKVQLDYTLKGGSKETYEPLFTFMGFRYVRIEGFPGELKPENLKGIVIHSEMRPTSSFETSDTLINQLQHNIIWGQKGNFLDVPTDCPQRDERLGWTGDAQAFVRTAAFNMDIQPFFTKWLKDVEADQFANGAIPFVVPDVLRNNGTSAGWADVAVIAPWTIYTSYGDRRILEEQYPSMQRYVEYIRTQAGTSMIWKGGSVFGDWLYYHPELFDHTTADGHTDHDLISTAFYAYSTSLLAKAAAVLGKTEDAAQYAALYDAIRQAFQRQYVSPAGRVYSGSQTSYVLALHFDLLPEPVRQAAADYLVEDIGRRGFHLSTGFLGTPYLCHVLSKYGHAETAYKLLFQETFPSWLYPVKMGATTIWERWDGIRADSSFQDKGMNSFNHYAYGAIGEWMYRESAGIDFDERYPGYKHFTLWPRPGGRFRWVSASHESPYGTIRSSWKAEGGKFAYEVTIPPNTTAEIILPGAAGRAVMMNNKPISVQTSGKDAAIRKGSGVYRFEW